MPTDLLDIFHIISNGCKVKVTEEKTKEIRKKIRTLDDPEQIRSCLRILLSYYPEESLIEFCLDSLFMNARPNYLSGPKHDIWIREVCKLAEAIKDLRVPYWEFVMYRKVNFYCPQLVDKIWKDGVPAG